MFWAVVFFSIAYVQILMVLILLIRELVARRATREFRTTYMQITAHEPTCSTCPFRKYCLFVNSAGICAYAKPDLSHATLHLTTNQ